MHAFSHSYSLSTAFSNPCVSVNTLSLSRVDTVISTRARPMMLRISLVGASLSEPHCYVANRGKRNAFWCVRTRNFSTVIKIPSACDRNFYQFVVNLPIVFPSSQLLRQFAWLRISQDASHFARRFTFRKTQFAGRAGRTITVNMD